MIKCINQSRSERYGEHDRILPLRPVICRFCVVFLSALAIRTLQHLQFFLQDLVHSSIGYGVRFNPNFYYNIHPPSVPTKATKNEDFPECIAAGQQNRIWGEVYMLKGQISSLQLFNESLSQSTLAELFLAGRSLETSCLYDTSYHKI